MRTVLPLSLRDLGLRKRPAFVRLLARSGRAVTVVIVAEELDQLPEKLLVAAVWSAAAQVIARRWRWRSGGFLLAGGKRRLVGPTTPAAPRCSYRANLRSLETAARTTMTLTAQALEGLGDPEALLTEALTLAFETAPEIGRRLLLRTGGSGQRAVKSWMAEHPQLLPLS